MESPKEEQKDPLLSDPLLNDIAFALALDGVPEDQFSRYEKRRLCRLTERVSRL
jgi:hypothetical protein